MGSKVLGLKGFIFGREDNVVGDVINPLDESSNDCCSADDGVEVINEEITVHIRTSSLSLNSSISLTRNLDRLISYDR